MNKPLVLTTALAPIIWGSSYVVVTEFLPQNYPLTIAMLRALPVGLILLLLCRSLPKSAWIPKIILLGILNFSIFWWLLFISAYRLPGGVAATLGALQPLIVIAVARLFLSTPIVRNAIFAALLGISGVALLLLNSQAVLDSIGILAGIAGACSMALGTVLSKKWFMGASVQQGLPIPKTVVTPLALTAWQLVAGGAMLIPFAFWFEPPLPTLSLVSGAAFVYLGLIGAGATYLLWFRGLANLPAASVASLGFLSPLSAVILGWMLLDQQLTVLQVCGALIVLVSVWLSQQKLTPKNQRTELRSI